MLEKKRGKIKVLMVCEAFGGGVYAYVSQLCNDLAGDFDISLAYSIRPQTPSDFKVQIDSRVHLVELPEMGNVSSPARLSKAIAALRHIEHSLKPNIIHLHSSIAGALGRIAFSDKDARVVYTPHGYAHVLLGDGFKSTFYRAVEKILGTRPHITLTCCESEDEEARRLTSHTAFIETGLDVEEFDCRLDSVRPKKSERFTVYTLGRACSQKRPALFNEIAKLVPDAHFIWIGGGELEGELTAKNVEVTGWLPRYEALSLAKGADAFVLCSRGEAIAMSLLENMSMGPLSLVSNVMGNRSVIQDGVNGYVCDDARGFASRIEGAMKDYPSKLTEQARHDIETIYNSRTMRDKYVHFYKEISGSLGLEQ